MRVRETRRAARRLGLVLLLATLSPALYVGAEDVAVNEGNGRTIDWMPAAEFYPQYIADPLRPQSALKILYLAESEIP